MKYVVTTQVLENYGAHDSESTGRYRDGQSYWKFKGGSDYVVSDVDRPADAMAFVMAARSHNGLGYKEFPTTVQTYADWFAGLPDDEDYREFLVEQAQEVSPKRG